MRLKAVCIMTLLACFGTPFQTFADDSVERLNDPVFLVPFKPSEVRFDPVSAELSDICHLPKSQPYWVFSHITDGDTQYYIVGSYDKDGYNTGRGLKLNGKVCLTENSENVFFVKRPVGGYADKDDTGQLPGLTDTLAVDGGHKLAQWNMLHSPGEERVYKALVSDALVRVRRAWNNDEKFRALLCASDHLALFDGAPLLLSEVKSICSSGFGE